MFLIDGFDLFLIFVNFIEFDFYMMGCVRVGIYIECVSFDFFVDNFFDECLVIGISLFFNFF